MLSLTKKTSIHLHVQRNFKGRFILLIAAGIGSLALMNLFQKSTFTLYGNQEWFSFDE